MGCFAHETCAFSEISNVKYIVGTGLRALQNSTIASSSNNDLNFDSRNMNVYLLGRDAGDGSNITCNINDNCTIYVWNNEIYYNISSLSCNNCLQLIVYSLTQQEILVQYTSEPS